MSVADLPLWGVAALLLAAAAVIGLAGVRMSREADRLADATGMGEAIFGAVFLGGATSLPGIVTSVTAAWQGYPELAASNAVGGIAAQTAFLAIADMAHRGVNLEHAAASIENLIQGALLVTLLALPVAAMAGPEAALWGVHPATPLLFAGYVFGMRLVSQARSDPLWRPEQTRETRADEPPPRESAPGRRGLILLWVRFALLALVVGAAGYTVAQSGIALVERAGLSETLVGGLFSAVATSLPELVTAVAAVRQGALTLAVGGIIGGNSFDVLFLAWADVAYRDGSLYHAMTNHQVFLIAVSQLMTGVLLLGLLRREKIGIGHIGFESFLVLVFYLGTVALLFLT